MIEPESTHREAVLTIAYRLMNGKRVSLARLGELRVVHENARKQGAAWYPPSEHVVFDPSRTRGENEPPSVVDFLSREIRSRLAEDGHARIDGLGVFTDNQTGIDFSAASDLLHVVNQEFAHLEAHEQPRSIEGAFAVPPVTSGSDEASRPDLQDMPPEPTEDLVVESEGEVPVPADANPDEPTPVDTHRPRSASLRERRDAQNSVRPWVVALLIVVPLVAVGVYVLVNGSDPVTQPASEPVEVPPTQPLDIAENAEGTDIVESTEMDSLEASPQELPSSTNDATQRERDTDPRDAAPSLSRGMDGYTLITASTSRESSAAAQLETLSQLNLPTGILYFDTEGGPRYRAAIGQWPSAVAADSARQALANELPPGTWVKRLN